MKSRTLLTCMLFSMLLNYNYTFAQASNELLTEHCKNKTSLFDHLYQMEARPEMRITTNVNKLIKGKMEEAYQNSNVAFLDSSEQVFLELDGRVRARGNVRKKVSYFPPVKIDFKKSELDSLGFEKTDKLKMVFPCDKHPKNQEILFKEFLVYELYNLIDSNYLRTKLVDVTLHWKGKDKYQFTGVLIEDEKEYARRMDLKIVEKGSLPPAALHRTSFLKMVFFQYMIANTDWSVKSRHNLEMVKLPEFPRVVAMPYDFDYSGFVGQHYAVPSPNIPIDNIHERYFFDAYRVSVAEYEQMVQYYLSIEKELYAVCDNASYMSAKTISESKKYLKSFFDMLRDSKELKGLMVRS